MKKFFFVTVAACTFLAWGTGSFQHGRSIAAAGHDEYYGADTTHKKKKHKKDSTKTTAEGLAFVNTSFSAAGK